MTVMKSTLVLLLALLALVAAGCNSAQAGAGVGAGVGALAGQAIGGNTSSTLIGAGAGAATGYMVGNELDKQKSEQERAELQRQIDQDRWDNEQRAARRQQALQSQHNQGTSQGTTWNSEPSFQGSQGSQGRQLSSWEFTGEGSSLDEARRSARGQARRAIKDRVDYWADRSLSAARRDFNLRNPIEFQSHFNLASDVMLQAAEMDSTVRREGTEHIVTIRVNATALRDKYRKYAAEADRYVNQTERQSYRQWCDGLKLGSN